MVSQIVEMLYKVYVNCLRSFERLNGLHSLTTFYRLYKVYIVYKAVQQSSKK